MSGRTQHCRHVQAESESWPSVAELEQEGVRELLQSEAAGQLQQRYTFLYARAPDLRMEDVPVLLRQYKELVLKHEAMVYAIEAHRAKQQSGAAATQAPTTAGTAVLHAVEWLLPPHCSGSPMLLTSLLVVKQHQNISCLPVIIP